MRLAVNPFERLDVLVVGSGVAGLSAAVRLAELGGARVGVLTKGELEQSTTRWAQGGIAAVLPGDEDSTDLHLADTLRAGAGLCDQAAVRVLVDEGSERVHELIALGAVFDRGPGGRPFQGEGRRSLDSRASCTRAAPRPARKSSARSSRQCETVPRRSSRIGSPSISLSKAVRCTGVVSARPHGRAASASRPPTWFSRAAARDRCTRSRPIPSRRPATASPWRCGPGSRLPTWSSSSSTRQRFITRPCRARSSPEALRGHGAVLRDGAGNRFVDELLPRDLVSRAIAVKLAEEGSEHVWLDATGLEDFGRRFPTIAETLQEAGFDPTHDWLPVAPAAHYLSGGVLVDLDGATALPGLWAAGEVACSGVHGANRLASNSLLGGHGVRRPLCRRHPVRSRRARPDQARSQASVPDRAKHGLAFRAPGRLPCGRYRTAVAVQTFPELRSEQSLPRRPATPPRNAPLCRQR